LDRVTQAPLLTTAPLNVPTLCIIATLPALVKIPVHDQAGIVRP